MELFAAYFRENEDGIDIREKRGYIVKHIEELYYSN